MGKSTVATAPTIAVEKIRIERGFNARTREDAKALDALASNIARNGVIQPVLLRFDEDGTAWLVAGHRRVAASQRIGLGEIPYNVYAGENRHEASMAENAQREDLDPIDMARGMKAIAQEHNLKRTELAKRMDRSVAWVGARLRLLDLPEGVQELVAAEVVPVEGEPLLREVAKVSPRIAECICITAKRREIPKGSFVKAFDKLLPLTSVADFPDAPTMIDVSRTFLSDLVADRTLRSEFQGRILAVSPHAGEDPIVQLAEEDIDAARAAGCLLEHKVDHGSWTSTLTYLTEADFSADLARRVVERKEAAAKKRLEEEAAWGERNGGSAPASPEKEKEARAEKRAAAKAKAESARVFNGNLGIALLKRHSKATRKRHALSRAQAVAAILLTDNPALPGRALSLVFSQLQEGKVKDLKSGRQSSKVLHADKNQCLAFVQRQIKEAKCAEEVLEILGDTLIAAELADQDERPQSRRVGWWSDAQKTVARLLAEDIRSVKPRRSRKK